MLSRDPKHTKRMVLTRAPAVAIRRRSSSDTKSLLAGSESESEPPTPRRGVRGRCVERWPQDMVHAETMSRPGEALVRRHIAARAFCLGSIRVVQKHRFVMEA